MQILKTLYEGEDRKEFHFIIYFPVYEIWANFSLKVKKPEIQSPTAQALINLANIYQVLGKKK